MRYIKIKAQGRIINLDGFCIIEQGQEMAGPLVQSNPYTIVFRGFLTHIERFHSLEERDRIFNQINALLTPDTLT